jgi:hypothetical protein
MSPRSFQATSLAETAQALQPATTLLISPLSWQTISRLTFHFLCVLGEGDMSDGQVLVLAGPLVWLLDFGNYTLKDWAQLLVAVFGLVGSA